MYFNQYALLNYNNILWSIVLLYFLYMFIYFIAFIK